jgi:16S rRNA processing protein RimM
MGRDKSTMLVGRIGGAYGIKGWVHIHSFTGPLENIIDYSPWRLHATIDGKLCQSIDVVKGKLHGKGLVAQLQGVNDRNGAESLKGLEIRVERERMPEPAGDKFYWADLEGLRVEDSAGTELGQVDQMLDTGSADVMVITGEQRHLIPFVYGDTVVAVDLDAGCIRVDWDAGDEA